MMLLTGTSSPRLRTSQKRHHLSRPRRMPSGCWANSKSSTTCSKSRWTASVLRGTRCPSPRRARDCPRGIARRRCLLGCLSASRKTAAVRWCGQMVWVLSALATGVSRATQREKTPRCVRPTAST